MSARENRQKWVAALRSGEYDQTDGVLHDSSGYCCLGVACDLYAKETGHGEWIGYDGGEYYGFKIAGRHAAETTLPYEVARWLGLSDVSGSYDEDPAYTDILGVEPGGCLADDNDRGAEFGDIADLIEDEPLGLVDVE